MEYNISQAIGFMREKLFTAFEYGCHLTAPAPIIIQPAPPSFAQIKARLLEGDDLLFNKDGTESRTKKQHMETLLDNTIKQLEAGRKQPAPNAASNTSAVDRLTLPLLRRMTPKLAAFDLIGVQPMTGPLSHVHTLRVRYSDPVVPSPEIATADTPPVLQGVASPNRLSIQILKEVVEARSRKLGARWTPSTLALPEDETVEALACEIAAEIDQELLIHLYNLAGEPNAMFSMTKQNLPDIYVGDQMAALSILINRQCSLIAARTRRGCGNYCVVSPTALTILRSATTAAFTKTTKPDMLSSGISFAGLLNNSMNVFVNAYARDEQPVLIGYRGNDMDTPVIYAPYVPVISSGVVIDPATFEPVISFMTRYGMHTLTNTPTSLGNAADYLGLVGIETKQLSFV